MAARSVDCAVASPEGPPGAPPPDDLFKLTCSPRQGPDEPSRLEIHFKDALPPRVVNLDDGTDLDDPLELFLYLNEEGGRHGVGRVDMVENRFVGIKSRGVYETPGGTVLLAAHRAIESITLDRGAAHLKDEVMPRYAELIYNGFWFSPEREALQALIDKTQELVNGTVRLKLYKGGVTVVGRKSPNSLYSIEHVTFEEDEVYDQRDAAGFIKLHALRLRLAAMERGGS